jgi:hypothetical protein
MASIRAQFSASYIDWTTICTVAAELTFSPVAFLEPIFGAVRTARLTGRNPVLVEYTTANVHHPTASRRHCTARNRSPITVKGAIAEL